MAAIMIPPAKGYSRKMSLLLDCATILLEQSSSGQDIHQEQTVNCGASNIASAVIQHWCDAANRPKVLRAMEEK